VLPFDALSDTVKDADERRLFYVALTRAKEEVVITNAERALDGGTLLPSQFISELKQELVSYEDTVSIEESLPGLYGRYVIDAKPTSTSAHDVAYLQSLFLEQAFSVTALNSYLHCPWQYFFMNLIRLPRTYNKHQQYGTAVHDALKKFFDAYAIDTQTPQETLLRHFRESLASYVPDEVLREDLRVKGENALATYYDTYKGTWPQALRTEFAVYGIDFPFTEGQITLTGKLDKLEFVDGHRVNVVDYKTGKPKSRNELMGETKSGTGDYFRQLVFYKVLLDRFDNGAYRMETGTIDFVEPQGETCVREVFSISDEHTQELVELIAKTASDIYNLNFWNTRCETAGCEFCALRDMMPE
jgi:DNA helicase-2/ATP-dependent DNA helicase PcrA